MTDTHDDGTERTDPVLVRPYVKTGEASSTGETWPSPAPSLMEDADTLVQPAVEDPPPAPAPRPRGLSVPVRLLALIGGGVLALAVGAWLILGTGDDTPAQPGVALPTLPGGVPIPAGPGASAGRSAPPSSVPASSGSASPSAGLSASVSASASIASSVSAGASVSASAAAPASVSASPTVPATDRTGAITAAGGRCLAVGSLLGLDNSPVAVSGCADVAYQHFTVAADGTLRVNGRCAHPTGDGTVRIAGCDGASGARWSGGAGGTLVNTATGQCLTDPGRSGATTTVTACTGAASQTWTLPS